jgi:hypothetical protein
MDHLRICGPKGAIGFLAGYQKDDVHAVQLPQTLNTPWEFPAFAVDDFTNHLADDSRQFSISTSYAFLRKLALSSSSSTSSTGVYTPYVQRTWQREMNKTDRHALADSIASCVSNSSHWNATDTGLLKCGTLTLALFPNAADSTTANHILPAYTVLSASTSEPLSADALDAYESTCVTRNGLT